MYPPPQPHLRESSELTVRCRTSEGYRNGAGGPQDGGALGHELTSPRRHFDIPTTHRTKGQGDRRKGEEEEGEEEVEVGEWRRRRRRRGQVEEEVVGSRRLKVALPSDLTSILDDNEDLIEKSDDDNDDEDDGCKGRKRKKKSEREEGGGGGRGGEAFTMETIKVATPSRLANVVRGRSDKALIIDSRTFCEYNTSHIHDSVNVWSSKIRKKRLQQDSISVHEYLQQACQMAVPTEGQDIIVYDQSAPSLSAVPPDSFLHVLLTKLGRAFQSVYLLNGGFLEFQAHYPELCEDSSKKCTPLTSLSQPCLPVTNVGSTRILPFLYLGSQEDANNKQLLQDHNILYELNVSNTCPKPDFIQESHFLRIPVNDNFSEKLLPYFGQAFNFIDKVREAGGCVLVHCLAGISRSATVAIAYVMKHLKLPFEEAYMYVKNRRPTISPNINFVGQLAELDRQLRQAGQVRSRTDPVSAPVILRGNDQDSTFLVGSLACSPGGAVKERCNTMAAKAARTALPRSLSLGLKSQLEAVPASPGSTPQTPPDASPSAALARLSFASALDDLHDDGLPASPSRCPGGSSPSTPLFAHSSHFLASGGSPTPGLPPSATPPTARERDSATSPVFSFSKNATSSSSFSSFYSTSEVSSTARFLRQASHHRPPPSRPREPEGRQVSVCVIDVKHDRDPSPVSFVRSKENEPMIIRETAVYATPCERGQSNEEVRSTLEVQVEGVAAADTGGVVGLDPPALRAASPGRSDVASVTSSSSGGTAGRPCVLELSVPIHVQPRPVHVRPSSPREGATPPREIPGPLQGVQQCDSGILVSEAAPEGNVPHEAAEPPPSPHRLPRCYSSSETHLNNRRLLEYRHGPEYAARKCSSSDEVGRGWQQPPHHHGTSLITAREKTDPRRDPLHPTTLRPWELARSDSVSTSGLGSEISDTDFFHDDAHSGLSEETQGPFEAVFSDVFPGEASSPAPPRTPRPASLPGVTGSYFSQLEINRDPGELLELRRGGGTRNDLKKDPQSFFPVFTEHPPASSRTMGEGARHTTMGAPHKERPRDLLLFVSSSPSTTSSSPSTTSTSPSMPPLSSPRSPSTLGGSSDSINSSTTTTTTTSSRAKSHLSCRTPEMMVKITSGDITHPLAAAHRTYLPNLASHSVSAASSLSSSSAFSSSSSAFSSSSSSVTSSSPSSSASSTSSTPSTPPSTKTATTVVHSTTTSSASTSSSFSAVSDAVTSTTTVAAAATSTSTTTTPVKERGLSPEKPPRQKHHHHYHQKQQFSKPLQQTQPFNRPPQQPQQQTQPQQAQPQQTQQPQQQQSQSPQQQPSSQQQQQPHSKQAVSHHHHSHHHSHSHSHHSKQGPQAQQRVTPEKRKIRASSIEEKDEKRRSCEIDTSSWSSNSPAQTPPPSSSRQHFALGAGVRMAQELLRGVEQLLDSEMGDIRRRTAALSARLRGRADSPTTSTSTTSSSSTTPTALSPSSITATSSSSTSTDSRGKKFHTTRVFFTTVESHDGGAVGGGGGDISGGHVPGGRIMSIPSGTSTPATTTTTNTNRARSEPPYMGEEGLYRARSCPGLPRAENSSEASETVAALVSDPHMVRLRGTRPVAAREKLLNRYSCGALDVQQTHSLTDFESCPDFGNLRPCVPEGDSLHSSSSSISSHSSFTRLLQVS
ncbi:uncharacterized protein LOC143025488 isoform X4 [Oratosquilla oratoria]|uniref:uncharacterized protein LOC143025488 isoform X4 n=1 Tax=Oratosquilla oratoria TaxID=337810 RepID=UPI003F768937